MTVLSRPLRRGLTVAAAVVAAAALGWGMLFILRGASASRETAAVMRKVDNDISQGYRDRAASALLGLRALPSGEDQLLGVLKRAYVLSKSAGDYGLLSSLAARAQAANPRSGRIRTVAAYAELRTGSPAAALKALRRGGMPGEMAADLRGEAAMRTGSADKPSGGLAAELAALQGSKDPSVFQETARKSGEPSLLLDAALLLMGQGELSRAARLASDLPPGRLYDEPAGFISYDSGDYASARSRLARRAGIYGTGRPRPR